MEVAAVACRGGGVLARPLPGHRAWRHRGVGLARRRFFVVASLGEVPSAPSRNAVAVAQEIAQADEYVASTENLPPPHDPAKTVRVKFVLQKRCAFGQRFIVVGDDPALGLWDPANAAALEWSEGHVWTATKDLPANKLVEFKFLLQDPSGQATWQNGYNRTLQVTETSNTLVVYEDWDDAKCQEVSEVLYPSIGAEDVHSAGSCNGAMLADDTQIDANQQTDKGLPVVVGTDGGSSPPREKMWEDEVFRSQGNHRLVQVINHRATYGFLIQHTLERNQKVPDVLRRRASIAAQADSAGRNGGNALYEEGAPVENGPAGTFENDMVWLRKALWRIAALLC